MTLGAVDKVNFAHISHNLRARNMLHGKRVRKRLFHCHHENMKLSKWPATVLKVSGRGLYRRVDLDIIGFFSRPEYSMLWAVDVGTYKQSSACMKDMCQLYIIWQCLSDVPSAASPRLPQVIAGHIPYFPTFPRTLDSTCLPD